MIVAKSAFKKPAMQNMYEKCRALAADGKMGVIHGSTDDNYWRGRKGLYIWKGQKDCLAYAAFCAGVDDRSAAIKAGKE